MSAIVDVQHDVQFHDVSKQTSVNQFLAKISFPKCTKSK